MKKLYNEFFYVPKHGKVKEKVMLVRTAITVIIMVACLVAMSITAYAYFSYNVTSGSNIIKAASFYTDVTVQITAEDGTAVETITANTSDHKSHSATLKANKTYTITLQHNERSTAQTGFVIITAKDCGSRYHTQQISRNEDGRSKTVTFKLRPTDDTVVTFCSHWGTSSNYPDFKDIKDNSDLYVQDSEAIEMVVNPPVKFETENETTPAESTTPSTLTSIASSATVTTTSATTGTSEPTSTTEPSSSATKPSAPTDATTSTKTQPTSETTGASKTEANNE